MTTNRTNAGRLKRITLILAVVILAPCLFGFWIRLSEFIATARQDSLGAFAIVPIFNYLLATCGFVLMMIWAVLNGMFKDVEAPKFDLLRRERMLDESDDDQDDWWKGEGGDDDPMKPFPGDGDANEVKESGLQTVGRELGEPVHHG
jgi:hypothetical protein